MAIFAKACQTYSGPTAEMHRPGRAACGDLKGKKEVWVCD